MSKISIPEVVDAFREYKKKNGVWGSLHIVLSDGNVRDSDVEFCVAWPMAKGGCRRGEASKNSSWHE